MPKNGVLLINLGTPDSPSVADVRTYLREFLMDARVIDIPYWRRFLLVQGIIAPFRAPKSAVEYRKLWTPEGSPLLHYGLEVKRLLQKALGEEYLVALGMRYQNPSIASALAELKDKGLERLMVLPLYPQYASASTGSTIEKVMEELKSWPTHPAVEIISQFFEHPKFIEAFAEIGRRYMARKEYDHFVFTYHGLPERQILAAANRGYCQLNAKCCGRYHDRNRYCYRAQCYETTRLLAGALDLKDGTYSTCFQSRLGKNPWIKPYTDELLVELAGNGITSVLAFSPSFVADCLETTVEIGETYREAFQAAGGKQWDLVPSLNTEPSWIACLRELILKTQPVAAY